MSRRLRLPLKQPTVFMSRVHGPLGTVRELSTAIDPNFAYTVIFSRDAVHLGYAAASYKPPDWASVDRTQTPYVIGLREIERSVLGTLSKVSVGRLEARNVDALVLERDLMRLLPVDLVLGRTFLQNFRVEFDMKKGVLTLE